jgi:ATP-dependent DNA helicase RecQ
VKQGSKWQLTASALGNGFWDRAERLTELRRAEQEQMRTYVDLPFGEHMAFLIKALDGDANGVVPPSLPPLPSTIDPKRVKAAIAFLRRSDLTIAPRKLWSGGGMPEYGLSGTIPMQHRAQPGRALCVWGDAGWGSSVRQGKYHDGRFGDELVTACADMLKWWSPQPAPTWVTCVPSLRHPELVPDFARRLAGALQLPFELVLEKTRARPEQKTMQNSTQQARNLDGALALVALPQAGSVLLVDDMVDSRWTLTVAAWLLRANGSGPVWPLALAQTGRD